MIYCKCTRYIRGQVRTLLSANIVNVNVIARGLRVYTCPG